MSAVSLLIFINLLFLLRIIDIRPLISFIENFVSRDNLIETPFRHLLVLQGLLILSFMILLYQLKVGRDQKMSLLNRSAFYVCIFLLLLSIILRDSILTESGLYAEDKIFEYMTALLLLVSSSIFLFMLFKTGKKEWLRILVLSILFLSAFFIGMEEISWGQRILGLQTPDYLSTINKKDEINLHNTIPDPYDDIIYYSFYLILGLVFMSAESIKKWVKKHEFWKKLIPLFPPVGFFYYGILFYTMIVINHYGLDWEVYEQILSVMVLTYAINVYRNWRDYRANNNNNPQFGGKHRI